MLVISVGTAKSQSKDQDNPTPLTSNVISGTLSSDNNGDKYYYSFVAGPGDVTVTLTVEAANEPDKIVQAGLSLFDEREVQLGAYKSATTGSGYTAQVVENISVKSRQRVLVLISVTQYSTGHGKYRLRVSGAVHIGQDASPSGAINSITETARRVVQGDNTDNPECLPKKGILRVKMRDGSIRRIDLSQAEELTIEP
jgi:hypothetical protein